MSHDTSHQLQTLTTSLEECGPALSSIRLQLDDVWTGSNSALARCEDRVNNVKHALAQITDALRRLGTEVVAEEQHLQQRGDAYKADYQQSQRNVNQLTQSLSVATHRGDELQRRLEDTQDDLRYTKRRVTEGEQTVEDLKAQLRTANRQIEQLTAAAAAAPPTHQPPPLLPTHSVPSSAGGPGRPSTDSGFSDGSAAPNPGDRQRQNIAYGVLDTATSDFQARNYATADAGFADVQTMMRQLPSALRQNFDTASLAYHRAVCRAEIGTDNEAETKLTEFLQSYDRAAVRQKAHITHLLARTHVRLGRLDSALDHSCNAVGQWYEIDSSCDQYFDAVALLARIFHLQVRPARALAVINQCPENKKDYVRNKYAGLRATTTTTTTTPAQPAPRPGQTPAAPAPSGRLPTRSHVPAATRPPRSTAGSTVSGTTTSSRASKRAERYKQLPLSFRIALTSTARSASTLPPIEFFPSRHEKTTWYGTEISALERYDQQAISRLKDASPPQHTSKTPVPAAIADANRTQVREIAALAIAKAWQKLTKVGLGAEAAILKRAGEEAFGSEMFREALVEAVEHAG
ncbi:hypothetical protein B0A55_03027 [Friedmanniomyces simplex]|uniref:Fungal N-terminal domain-containing protein n=1 Tax=Friedmanniomyces simplex TaxID=329884 RepID=A0A4U0XRU1_9PEZI|nr:hypothetical protein B0A55_03027 [Friedmanniomyces simplex]